MIPLLVTAIILGFIFGHAVAQPAPQPPTGAPTCEAQLEEARNINIQIRKSRAQADFTAANMEETVIALQKRITDMEAKTKAAEAAPKK